MLAGHFARAESIGYFLAAIFLAYGAIAITSIRPITALSSDGIVSNVDDPGIGYSCGCHLHKSPLFGRYALISNCKKLKYHADHYAGAAACSLAADGF